MSEQKIPSHTASLISEYKTKDWTVRSKFTEICSIYETEKWALMFRIPKWMLLTGDVCIMPISEERKEVIKAAIEAKAARQAERNASSEDDLPF